MEVALVALYQPYCLVNIAMSLRERENSYSQFSARADAKSRP